MGALPKRGRSTSISTGCGNSEPRRFSTRTASWPSFGASARRNGAAVALPRWPGRRHSAPHVRPSRAATCNRRSARSSCVGSHANAAPHRRAQRLLERPQGVFRRLAVHDEKTREIETGRRERRRIRPVRRRDPHDVALLRLHVRERGQRQTDFADAFAFEQQLRQCALRRAASRQRSVERREARRHGRRFRRAIVAPPDRGIGEQRSEGRCGRGHGACLRTAVRQVASAEEIPAPPAGRLRSSRATR